MLFRAEVYTRKQLSQTLENPLIDKVYAPYNLIDESLMEYKDRIIVVTPIFLGNCESELKPKLKRIKEMGFNRALVHTIGHFELLNELDFRIHGGYRLNCANNDCVSFWEDNGMDDIIVSPEMTSFQINQLNHNIPIGFIAYGHLPLMITRRCPIKNGKPCNKTNCNQVIKDRMGNELSIICNENTAEILNSDVLFLGDKLEKFNNSDFCVFKFTTEENVHAIISLYANNETSQEKSFTRGLYFRGVKN